MVEDKLWKRVEPLLPTPKPRRFRYPGRKPLDNRQALTGILFVLKTGLTWNDLPQEMGCGLGVACWGRLSDRMHKLKDAIETMHRCKAVRFASEPVIELFRGEVAWDGVVETFDLTGHPRAKRCHAWNYEDKGETQSRHGAGTAACRFGRDGCEGGDSRTRKIIWPSSELGGRSNPLLGGTTHNSPPMKQISFLIAITSLSLASCTDPDNSARGALNIANRGVATTIAQEKSGNLPPKGFTTWRAYWHARLMTMQGVADRGTGNSVYIERENIAYIKSERAKAGLPPID